MGLKRTVEPSAEPLDLAEVKTWLRDIDSADDADVARQIASARDYCEQRTERALMPQTWLLTLDGFPAWAIRLPHPPLIGVLTVTYTDEAGDVTTISAADCKASVASEPGLLVPAYGLSWPIARCELDSVQVTYRAGYATAAAVPAGIKQAMRVLITARWEQRADEKLMQAVNDMLAAYWPGTYSQQPE